MGRLPSCGAVLRVKRGDRQGNPRRQFVVADGLSSCMWGTLAECTAKPLRPSWPWAGSAAGVRRSQWEGALLPQARHPAPCHPRLVSSLLQTAWIAGRGWLGTGAGPGCRPFLNTCPVSRPLSFSPSPMPGAREEFKLSRGVEAQSVCCPRLTWLLPLPPSSRLSADVGILKYQQSNLVPTLASVRNTLTCPNPNKGLGDTKDRESNAFNGILQDGVSGEQAHPVVTTSN